VSAGGRLKAPAALLVAGGLAASAALAQVSGAARLEVGWISREPRIPAPNRPDAPREEGWPDAGSRVHWVAHVLNRGPDTVAGVPYTWLIDGAPAGSGDVDLPPGETTVWLPWTWSFERHVVSFAIQPPAAVRDATADDDEVTMTSDALSLGFWIERGVYDWLAEGDRPGFERWAHRESGRWNQILARAVYPTSPEGVLDRLRVDQIIVAPDGSDAGMKELDTDLQWWVHTTSDDARFLQRYVEPRYLADQTIILHELLHERGLTDLYAYAVYQGGPTESRIEIRENGRLVAGTFLMPFLPASSWGVYRLPDNGLMGTSYRQGANLTEHSANGLDLRAGRRTPLWVDQGGNLINGFSSQHQRDSYLERLPAVTRIRLLDLQGQPLPGAEVAVFLDHSGSTYQDLYEAEPDSEHRADALGVVSVPGVQLAFARSAQAPPKSQTTILRVSTPTARGYAFLPVYDLNLLTFRGGVDQAETELRVELHPWSRPLG